MSACLKKPRPVYIHTFYEISDINCKCDHILSKILSVFIPVLRILVIVYIYINNYILKLLEVYISITIYIETLTNVTHMSCDIYFSTVVPNLFSPENHTGHDIKVRGPNFGLVVMREKNTHKRKSK